MFLHYKWDALNRCWYMHNFNLKHLNHPETKEHFNANPKQRRLNEKEQTEVEHLFNLHVPFRDLKREMRRITGKKN